MNFADNFKNMVIESAMKKEEVFNETFVSKDNLKKKVNAIRTISDENIEEAVVKDMVNAFCDLVDSMIDSEPAVTLTIEK